MSEGIAVPFQNPAIDPVDVLNEGQLELEASRRDGRSDWLAELRYDGLLDFSDSVDGGRRCYDACNRDPGDHE
jgi:hypothetical protein